MGIKASSFPSSIEAMLRRALKGGEPLRINPLVDFYNAVSLRHFVPVGGFDIDHLQSDFELRLTREGDHFTALDSQQPEYLPPNEVIYVSGSEVLTRHMVWRQAKNSLLSARTRNVLLICEVLDGLDDNLVDQVLNSFKTGLSEYFGVTPELDVLSEQHSCITF